MATYYLFLDVYINKITHSDTCKRTYTHTHAYTIASLNTFHLKARNSQFPNNETWANGIHSTMRKINDIVLNIKYKNKAELLIIDNRKSCSDINICYPVRQ